MFALPSNFDLLQRHRFRGRKKLVVEAEGLFLQLLSLNPTQVVKNETKMTKLMYCRILRLLSPSVSWTFFRRPSWKGFGNSVISRVRLYLSTEQSNRIAFQQIQPPAVRIKFEVSSVRVGADFVRSCCPCTARFFHGRAQRSRCSSCCPCSSGGR